MIRRPNPFRWLFYVYGGRLPEANREWVLHDVTTRTWWLRHLLRSLVQIAPFTLIPLLVIPGPFWIRAVAVIAGAVMGLIYSAAYMEETAEHRAMKAGYPVGTVRAMHQEAGAEERAEAAERYAREWRHNPAA